VWVKTVYDFAIGYKQRTINRDHLLRALTPLYLGWVASFIMQVQEAGPEDVERRLEKLCATYETGKPYLISRWRWPDRFNP
jgi:glucosylglycerate synthase